MRDASLCFVFTLAMAGCTFPTVVPEALNTEFKPLGEVAFRERTAAFDEVRVRAVNCNLSKRTDGSWGGTLGDRAVDVSVSDTDVRGVEMVVSREASQQGRLVISGQFMGMIQRFEIDQDRVMVRTQVTNNTFGGRVVSERGAKYGPFQELELRGVAGDENPPWPQIAFALIAAFN
jgi:hypothetical protein